jgi:OOP family OmpA-OmpF porin
VEIEGITPAHEEEPVDAWQEHARDGGGDSEARRRETERRLLEELDALLGGDEDGEEDGFAVFGGGRAPSSGTTGTAPSAGTSAPPPDDAGAAGDPGPGAGGAQGGLAHAGDYAGHAGDGGGDVWPDEADDPGDAGARAADGAVDAEPVSPDGGGDAADERRRRDEEERLLNELEDLLGDGDGGAGAGTVPAGDGAPPPDPEAEGDGGAGAGTAPAGNGAPPPDPEADGDGDGAAPGESGHAGDGGEAHGDGAAPGESGHAVGGGEAQGDGAPPGAGDAGGDPGDGLPPMPSPETELGRLRALLLEREILQIGRLEGTVNDSQALAQAVSRVITEALLLRSKRDDKLLTVLAPTVETIVTSSVRRSPETIANQIFPVIGPAIRRFISDTFVSMLQSFNSTLEMSLSLKGLKWRLEAWKVHRPFSEIVMLHTLLYHVEEIYLIHAESGLILDHIVAEGGESRDAELVAAMFTAIRDFIRDSFSVGQKEHLDNLRFGERSIFLQRTEKVFMAAVVRGNPPASLGRDLQDALELMAVGSADDLDRFKGDPAPFKKNRPFFQPFLEARYAEGSKKLPFAIRFAPLAAALLLALFLGCRWWDADRTREAADRTAAIAVEMGIRRSDARRFFRAKADRVADRLGRVPGLSAGGMRELPGTGYEMTIFKDDVADDPGEILRGMGDVAPDSFRLQIAPYVSTDPEIISRKVDKFVTVPPGVSHSFDNDSGTLVFTGTASRGWTQDVQPQALSISGVNRVDVSGVRDPDNEAAQRLQGEINGTVIHFPMGGSQPVPEDAREFEETIRRLKDLELLTDKMGVAATLTLYGHADCVGSDIRNYEISLERTKTVAARLWMAGSRMTVVNYSFGSDTSRPPEDPYAPPDPAPARGRRSQEPVRPGCPATGDPESRKLEFRVRLGNEKDAPVLTPEASGHDGGAAPDGGEPPPIPSGPAREAGFQAMESSVPPEGDGGAGLPADHGPPADQEPPDDREPPADQELPDDREPTDDREPPDDREPAADPAPFRETAPSREAAPDGPASPPTSGSGFSPPDGPGAGSPGAGDATAPEPASAGG